MVDVIIKQVSTNEANVSDRVITFDIYADGKYQVTTDDIFKAMAIKESITER